MEHKVYGHGDSGYELVIAKTGAYGSEGFPPLFTSEEAANEHMAKMPMKYKLKVVTVELVTPNVICTP